MKTNLATFPPNCNGDNKLFENAAIEQASEVASFSKVEEKNKEVMRTARKTAFNALILGDSEQKSGKQGQAEPEPDRLIRPLFIVLIVALPLWMS